MRKQYKRYLFLFCSLAALLMGLSGTGVAFAQGHARLASLQKATMQTCGSWSIVPSPNEGTTINELLAVAAVSSSDVWAVGYYNNTRNPNNQTLTEHWNGTSWSVVTSPDPGTATDELSAVAAVSSSDVWAVGYYRNKNGNSRTLTEYWDGTSWSVVASPNVGTDSNELGSVAVVSSSDIWAVGSYTSSSTGNSRTLTEHWNGTSWSVVASPNVGNTGNSSLGSVAAISTSDVWAVGSYYPSTGEGTLTMHWNGTKWSIVSSPNIGNTEGNSLSGVAAVSSSDVWAVGSAITNSYTSPTLIEQWDGTKWSIVTSPNISTTDGLDGVAVVSSSDVWAVGSYNPGSAIRTLTEQWNGTSWSVVKSPNVGPVSNGLSGVAVSGSDVWAVGYTSYSNKNIWQTLIEFYC